MPSSAASNTAKHQHRNTVRCSSAHKNARKRVFEITPEFQLTRIRSEAYSFSSIRTQTHTTSSHECLYGHCQRMYVQVAQFLAPPAILRRYRHASRPESISFPLRNDQRSSSICCAPPRSHHRDRPCARAFLQSPFMRAVSQRALVARGEQPQDLLRIGSVLVASVRGDHYIHRFGQADVRTGRQRGRA